MKLTGLFWNFDPPPPTPPPPRVGWVKTNCIDFLDSSWHFPDFWFFDPLKFPLRPPPPWVGRSIFLGRNHPQICRDLCILNPFSDLFFAFKVTISRHFAGYASVALETIWLHEPRDLIFLGPPMTLLCLSRYSRLSSFVAILVVNLINTCARELTSKFAEHVGPTLPARCGVYISR